MKQLKKKNNEGFTLVEVIAVLVILGILAAVAVPKYIDLQENAQIKALDAGVSELNGREAMTWGDSLLSDGGYTDDDAIVAAMEYELGADAVANIHFEDSSRCLELFESVNIAQPSIFKLIDEQGGLGSNGSDVNLLRRLEQTFITPRSNPHIMKASQFDTQQFKISHYAGEVIYDVEGFTEKNKDALSDTLTQTL